MARPTARNRQRRWMGLRAGTYLVGSCHAGVRKVLGGPRLAADRGRYPPWVETLTVLADDELAKYKQLLLELRELLSQEESNTLPGTVRR
jgi:hypothetical protein